VKAPTLQTITADRRNVNSRGCLSGQERPAAVETAGEASYSLLFFAAIIAPPGRRHLVFAVRNGQAGQIGAQHQDEVSIRRRQPVRLVAGRSRVLEVMELIKRERASKKLNTPGTMIRVYPPCCGATAPVEDRVVMTTVKGVSTRLITSGATFPINRLAEMDLEIAAVISSGGESCWFVMYSWAVPADRKSGGMMMYSSTSLLIHACLAAPSLLLGISTMVPWVVDWVRPPSWSTNPILVSFAGGFRAFNWTR
jgi:hypothetical protein